MESTDPVLHEPHPAAQLTSTHWGAYRVRVEHGRVTALEPFERDSDPSPIGQSIPGALDSAARVSEHNMRDRVGRLARPGVQFVNFSPIRRDLAEVPDAQWHPIRPHTKLHSQYDHGSLRLENKIKGREPVLMHPEDAHARGIAEGDVQGTRRVPRRCKTLRRHAAQRHSTCHWRLVRPGYSRSDGRAVQTRQCQCPYP